MRYRPEIDGLRAVAVVPVIFFHAQFSGFPGGFVGVDVFFVISGFLITTIILDDLAAGRFSIIGFYERRLRRIAPALLFVCLACLPFAAMWMLPPELKAFGKMLFHSLLMVSNFLLWGEVDYFEASNELKPLLHTWSLSVEEQFYLVFPPLLWLLHRSMPRRMLTVVAALAVLSFVLTWPLSAVDPVGNFYLPVTRFWELAAGAMLAIHRPESIRLPDRLKSVLALAGLFAIAASCVLLTTTSHYPGPATLVPAIGTLLVLAFASPQNLAGRLLGLRPLVWIGLISYSLYLWHQPVFAFARLRLIDEVPAGLYLWLIALTFALSVFTYVFVETPFRRGRVSAGRRIFGLSGAISAALIIAGIAVSEADGFPDRAGNLTAIRVSSIGLGRACNGTVNPDCETGPAPVLAVWGDSFAMHVVDGIVASQPAETGGLMQLNMSNCAPLMDVAPVLADQAAHWPVDCLSHNRDVRAHIAATPSLRYVMLSSQFRTYLENRYLMAFDGTTTETRYDAVLRDLEANLDWLRSIGLKPVVFAPPPRTGRDSGICVSRVRLLGMSDDRCLLPRADQRSFDADVERLMTDVARRFPVVSIEDYLCDETVCRVIDQGVPFYRDDGHFSVQGSKHLGTRLDFYDRLVTAAEHGCAAGGDGEPNAPPHGICQIMPDGGADLPRGAGQDIKVSGAKATD